MTVVGVTASDSLLEHMLIHAQLPTLILKKILFLTS